MDLTAFITGMVTGQMMEAARTSCGGNSHPVTWGDFIIIIAAIFLETLFLLAITGVLDWLQDYLDRKDEEEARRWIERRREEDRLDTENYWKWRENRECQNKKEKE